MRLRQKKHEVNECKRGGYQGEALISDKENNQHQRDGMKGSSLVRLGGGFVFHNNMFQWRYFYLSTQPFANEFHFLFIKPNVVHLIKTK